MPRNPSKKLTKKAAAKLIPGAGQALAAVEAAPGAVEEVEKLGGAMSGLTKKRWAERKKKKTLRERLAEEARETWAIQKQMLKGAARVAEQVLENPPKLIPGPGKDYKYPLLLGYGDYVVLGYHHHGQGDPLYAVLSRRGNALDRVVVMASERELDRVEDAIEEILGSRETSNTERHVATGLMREVITARAGGRAGGVVAEANSKNTRTGSRLNQRRARRNTLGRKDWRYAATWPMWGKWAYGNPSEAGLPLYQDLLAHLVALRWFYWTTHWTVAGPNYYGDHQLLERLYDGKKINRQVDGLGERMVAYFGPRAVDPADINGRVQEILARTGAPNRTGENALYALNDLEVFTQAAIHRAWEAEQALRSQQGYSLGLDNFLMQLADERDQVRYLLGQRLGGRPKASANPRRLALDQSIETMADAVMRGKAIASYWAHRGELIAVISYPSGREVKLRGKDAEAMAAAHRKLSY